MKLVYCIPPVIQKLFGFWFDYLFNLSSDSEILSGISVENYGKLHLLLGHVYKEGADHRIGQVLSH